MLEKSRLIEDADIWTEAADMLAEPEPEPEPELDELDALGELDTLALDDPGVAAEPEVLPVLLDPPHAAVTRAVAVSAEM